MFVTYENSRQMSSLPVTLNFNLMDQGETCFVYSPTFEKSALGLSPEFCGPPVPFLQDPEFASGGCHHSTLRGVDYAASRGAMCGCVGGH